jgi:hypothetical protein
VNLAPPQRGDAIRYAYLWADENARGRDEARNDRPAVVVAVSVTAGPSQTRVLVLAVTQFTAERCCGNRNRGNARKP